jgi:hypothetical protein
MTPDEVALAAALGSSALTGAAALGVVWVQEWRRRKAADRDALQGAVTELLWRSMAVASRARALGEAMKFRSGLKEGLDVTLHHRKPADPFELHDWLAQDLVPLHAALSELWTRADQDGVRLANELAGKCGDLLGVSTARQQADGSWERARRWAMGDRWTSGMIAANDKAMVELAQARKRFAEHARARLGYEAVELFLLPETQESAAGPGPQAVSAADQADVNGTAGRVQPGAARQPPSFLRISGAAPPVRRVGRWWR